MFNTTVLTILILIINTFVAYQNVAYPYHSAGQNNIFFTCSCRPKNSKFEMLILHAFIVIYSEQH